MVTLCNVHNYDYDALGRRTQDQITTLGTGVDGTVRRIPCVARFRAGITDAPEVEHPDIDPDQPQLPPARTASLLDQIHHHHEGTAHD